MIVTSMFVATTIRQSSLIDWEIPLIQNDTEENRMPCQFPGPSLLGALQGAMTSQQFGSIIGGTYFSVGTFRHYFLARKSDHNFYIFFLTINRSTRYRPRPILPKIGR